MKVYRVITHRTQVLTSYINAESELEARTEAEHRSNAGSDHACELSYLPNSTVVSVREET
jgi:hypothetical protein